MFSLNKETVFWYCLLLFHPTPVLLPGKSHGRRSLEGCSPWGRKESDTTEWLHFHFSLSCIGEGNGNPLQCSCQENPRDGGDLWAAVYGVARSQTWLKRLSSSSSSYFISSSFSFSSSTFIVFFKHCFLTKWNPCLLASQPVFTVWIWDTHSPKWSMSRQKPGLF